MIHRLLVCFVLGSMPVLPCLAEEDAAPDITSAAHWLDEAARWVDRVRAESPVDLAYDRIDIFFFLTLAESAADREAEALARLGQLRGAATVIGLMDRDPWAMSLLPGPMAATGQDADVKLTLAMLEDPALQLDAAIGLAEAYHVMGDAPEFAAQMKRVLELQPKAQAAYVAEAAADPNYEFDGTYAGWFAMTVVRERGDLDTARKLAALEWQDPAERAGVYAIAAQLEAWKGDPEKATKRIEGVRAGLKEAAKKQAELGDAYYPDLDTHLPEAAAAVWVVEGRDAAMALGAAHAGPDVIWRRAAMIHAATILRQQGKADAARAAADEAVALPLPGPDASATYDAMHLARELVRQNRVEDAAAYTRRLDDPMHRAYGCLGMAQGLLPPIAP